MKSLRWFLVGLPPIFLLGCGHSRETVVLTLDPVPPQHIAARSMSPPLSVGAIEFPPAFDRLAVVRQREAGRLRVDDFARWGAPLNRLARDVMLQNLQGRLPSGTVRTLDSPVDRRTVVVRLVVSRIVERDGMIDATVSWTARSEADPVQTSHDLHLTAPISRNDQIGMADALSRILGQLADDIATTVTNRT